MKFDKDAIVMEMTPQAPMLTDDHYLLEMTERIQKLRSLAGEQEMKKKRRKRWAE